MTNSNNPIVQDVCNRFNTVYDISKIFVTGNSAQKGLIISGDAGTGKSHFVQKAFIDTDTVDDVDYNKSESFTAAAFYVQLYLNRNAGDVIVFDDCNIGGLTGGDFKNITDMLKGATEMTKGERMIGWNRATQNQLMKDHGVPMSFDFQGSIIWITNYSFEQLANKFKAHWEAIQSRFISVPIRLNDQEKLMYTLHLVEEVDMLGKDCSMRENGYSKEVIEQTCLYLRKNWKSMDNVTPRVAGKIADTMTLYPNNWEMLLENQNIR